jgi:hypothetical protein
MPAQTLATTSLGLLSGCVSSAPLPRWTNEAANGTPHLYPPSSQLSVATNSSSYFTDATTYYKQYKLSGSSLVFNWDSMTPALPILFLQVVQNRPWLAGGASESYWQGEAENILDDIVGKDALKGGLLWVRRFLVLPLSVSLLIASVF